MCALGIYVGLPEETLLAYKEEALAQLGLAVTSYSDSGTSVNKTAGMPVAQRIQELNYALSRIDPVRYGGAHTSVQINWSSRVDI
jgi:hypothetical protein